MTTHRCGPLLRGLSILIGTAGGCSAPPPGTFATPEEAMQAIRDLAGEGHQHTAEDLFGPGGVELLRSGDEIADREDRAKVAEDITEKVAFEGDDNRKVALFGNEGWPFPIPLVRENDRWRFDAEAGREELENRRVGRNELLTLATLHAYVDAQREYASAGRDGKPPSFAQKLISTEGLHDGLYWPTPEGAPESPIGLLVAAAAQEGYQHVEGYPIPFHGYYYRGLRAQGKNAPGGARSYVDRKGLMTGGFGVLAWPAKYGNSGIMTFLVDKQGIVFQKDLGTDTTSEVVGIAAYDPDDSWDPTGD
jgi:hypothetical protein